MTKKPKKDSSSSIALRDLFGALSRKDRDWWNTLSQEQQEKFSAWLYNRYLSVPKSSNSLLNEYYLRAVNQHSNRNFNVIHKNHKKLQYLLMTTLIDPDIRCDHAYLKPMGKTGDKKSNTRTKILTNLMPTAKIDDIHVLADLMSDDEIKQMLRDRGWEEKQIKQAMEK